MRWTALTSGKTIVTGEHPKEDAADLRFLKGSDRGQAPLGDVHWSHPLDRI